jgi:SAM-dependent methyltransferase
VEAKYEARASLDPLRAVLDAGDPDNRKNAFVDFLEKRALEGVLGRRRIGTAVDLGCGVGRFFPLLSSRAGAVVGVDATEALLRAVPRGGEAGRARLVRGSAVAIPLRDASADLVFCSSVLIHVTDERDLASVAAEVRRVLRPGGRFVAIEHITPRPGSERREGIVYRSLSALEDAFLRERFTVLRDRPIRKVPSRVVHWVRHGRLPRALWPIGALLESALALRGREPPSYRDHLFVMERSAGAG